MNRTPITPDLTAAFADHDRLFKELLTVFFVEFVELFLPDIAAGLDVNSITFLDKEIFTDITSGATYEVDIIVRAQFRGSDAFFLIHVENQAKRQARFARRMFHYFARLDETYDLPIYPVALFSFDKPLRQEPDTYQVAFGPRTVLDFHFHAIQLNRLHWRDFLGRPNPVAAALMAKMQIAPEDRPRVKLECLRLLATLHLDPARTKLIAGFVDSYLKLTGSELQVFRRAVEALPPEEREAAMPLTISWKEEGRVEGRLEGRAEGLVEGRVEGARRMLLRAGEGRLGKPSAYVMAAVGAVDSFERLEELMSRLFAAESWEDLLAEKA